MTSHGQDMEQLLDEATAALRKAAEWQRADRDPAHEGFYVWGWALTEITDTLGQVCRVLAPQVSAYGDHRMLRDDQGADPYLRLREMRELVDALYSKLHLANTTARAYHSAAGHIAVEVDPDAEQES